MTHPAPDAPALALRPRHATRARLARDVRRAGRSPGGRRAECGFLRGVGLAALLALAALLLGGAWMFAEPAAAPPPGLASGTVAHERATSSFEVSPGGAPESSAPEAPADADPEVELARLRTEIDRPALVRLDARLVERLRADPDDLAASLALCATARLLGRPDDARQYGEHAVALAPDAALAHARLARALAASMRDGGMLAALRVFAPFKEHLLKARELDPDDARTRGDEIGFLSFAPGLVGGDSARALQLADALADSEPVQSVLLGGLALLGDDRIDDALARLTAGLAAHPGERSLEVGLGTLLAQAERYDEAEPHLRAAVEADDGPRDEIHWQAVYGLARLQIMAGRDLEQAVAALDLYLDVDPYGDMLPGRWGALFRRGQALAALGRHDEARRDLDACLALHPGYGEAEDALAALDAD